jgi:hypothetical protein
MLTKLQIYELYNEGPEGTVSSNIAERITTCENEANHHYIRAFVFDRFIFGATINAFSINGGASQFVLRCRRSRAAEVGFIFAHTARRANLGETTRRRL